MPERHVAAPSRRVAGTQQPHVAKEIVGRSLGV